MESNLVAAPAQDSHPCGGVSQAQAWRAGADLPLRVLITGGPLGA